MSTDSCIEACGDAGRGFKIHINDNTIKDNITATNCCIIKDNSNNLNIEFIKGYAKTNPYDTRGPQNLLCDDAGKKFEECVKSSTDWNPAITSKGSAVLGISLNFCMAL